LQRLRQKAPIILTIPACAVTAFFFTAVCFLFAYSFRESPGMGVVGGFSFEQYVKFFSDPYFIKYLLRTLKIGAYCTAITLVLSYPIAYTMSRSSSAVRKLFASLLICQFFTAYVIRMYALMLVLGNNGLINRAILWLGLSDVPLRLMYNELGVAVGLVMITIPFAVFPIWSVIESIDPNLSEAAQTLRANRFHTFFHVTMPLSLPGIGSAVIFVFLFDLSAFVTPALLGGGYYDMMANLIYEQVLSLFNYPFGGAVALIGLSISLILAYAINRIFEKLTKGIKTL